MSSRVLVAETLALRASLFEFRYAIYANELKARLTREAVTERSLRDEFDDVAINYVAVDGGAVIGSLRLVDARNLSRSRYQNAPCQTGEQCGPFREEERSTAGRLAVAAERRRGPLLRKLVAFAYAHAPERGIRLVVSDCSPSLLPLYQKIGYVRLGPAFNDPTFGFKLPIAWVLGDTAHMSAVHSPLLALAERYPSDADGADWARNSHTIARQPARGMACDARSFSPNLTDDEVSVLLDRSAVFEADAGDCVLRAGLREDAVYVVLSGCIEVESVANGLGTQGTRGPGDVLGGEEFLRGSEQRSNAIARAPSRLLAVAGDALRRIRRSESGLFAKMTAGVASTWRFDSVGLGS